MIRRTCKILSFATLWAISASLLISCIGNGNETIAVEGLNDNSTANNNSVIVPGIPSDTQASANPSVISNTTTIPNVQYAMKWEGDAAVMEIDMTGVQGTQAGEWMDLYGTANAKQNIWVEVDGKPKGIEVVNNSNQGSASTRMADLVFTVDNSGSMSEEANAIARDIVEWAQLLSQSGLDIRFGVVGYGGYVSGAMNLTNVTSLSQYLDEYTGTNRTMHFGGQDSANLVSQASAFQKTDSSVSGNECGAMAIRFADKYFNFRTGANRVYVNFTDEPNQPKGIADYSTESFKTQTGWSTTQGTIHTVYSSDTINYSTDNFGYQERPWRLSWYTGGTVLTASSSFSGVTLNSLPVTGALQHSYLIRFTNISDLLDGKAHQVHITIRSADGSTQAERTFPMVFGTMPNS